MGVRGGGGIVKSRVPIEFLPSQVVPFPMYPWLHVQVKLPGVLVHVALESQVVALAHSSISDIMYD